MTSDTTQDDKDLAPEQKAALLDASRGVLDTINPPIGSQVKEESVAG